MIIIIAIEDIQNHNIARQLMEIRRALKKERCGFESQICHFLAIEIRYLYDKYWACDLASPACSLIHSS